MPKMTGSRLFAEMMKGYGVTHAFFVPTILMKALQEMQTLGLHRVMTHGEKAAAYMADGYARASGRPGVCLAQQIGASNLCCRTEGRVPGARRRSSRSPAARRSTRATAMPIRSWKTSRSSTA